MLGLHRVAASRPQGRVETNQPESRGWAQSPGPHVQGLLDGPAQLLQDLLCGVICVNGRSLHGEHIRKALPCVRLCCRLQTFTQMDSPLV